MKSNRLSRRTFLKAVGVSPLAGLIPNSTTSAVSNESYDVLDLYGGRKVVLDKMEFLTRQKLSSISKEHRKYIYEEIQENKDPSKFIEFLNGKRKIDFKTFDMFKSSYLEMEIDEVLGEPCFKNQKIKSYWLNQIKENPMLLGGPSKSHSRNKNLELKFYVKLRAIGELVHTC